MEDDNLDDNDNAGELQYGSSKSKLPSRPGHFNSRETSTPHPTPLPPPNTLVGSPDLRTMALIMEIAKFSVELNRSYFYPFKYALRTTICCCYKP